MVFPKRAGTSGALGKDRPEQQAGEEMEKRLLDPGVAGAMRLAGKGAPFRP